MPSSYALAILILILAFFSLVSANAQSTQCNDEFSFIKMGTNITHCKKLGTLGAEFGWIYNGNIHNQTINIFFGARPHVSTGWVAWGVNPLDKPQMVGTRALIMFQQPNGSLVLEKYNITRETKHYCGLQPSDIDVEVSIQRLEHSKETGFLTMSAILTLPREYNLSRLNHVWQIGSNVIQSQPQMHSVTLHNVDSAETIDLATGNCRNAGHHRRHLRRVHGILNMIGWGTLVPIGVIISRYFREFPVPYKGWYYLHVWCQILAYILGTVGWGIGIWLGHASTFYTFPTHRIFGIIIFTFTTLQMFALWLKPKDKDEYRKYWDMYHHFLGYALIVLIIVNIFQGISILRPDEKQWKWAYVAVLGVLASITLALEIFTWAKFILIRNKRNG